MCFHKHRARDCCFVETKQNVSRISVKVVGWSHRPSLLTYSPHIAGDVRRITLDVAAGRTFHVAGCVFLRGAESGRCRRLKAVADCLVSYSVNIISMFSDILT